LNCARECAARLLELNPAMTIAGFKAFRGNFLAPGTNRGLRRRLSACRTRRMSQTRCLAAIFAADLAGTLERLRALRSELLDPQIAEHRGRLVKTTGDGMLVEFASVVDALSCAVAVRQAMPASNTDVGADSHIEPRIGINLGDVIVEGDDLYGDGVDIARCCGEYVDDPVLRTDLSPTSRLRL